MELLQSSALPLGYVAGNQRVAGIEPAHQPWEGRRLPLHHTRPSTPVRQARPCVLPTGGAALRHALSDTAQESLVAVTNRAGVVWIYGVPTWLFMILAVAVSCAIAVGLLAIVRSRITRNEQITHNDVAGPILATIGTVLAVMMSFMVVGVWQEYDQAAQNVQTEASAASDLHHIADAFPKGMRADVQNTVDRYITVVLNEEWPLMQHGGESQAAHDTAYRIQSIIEHYAPRDPVQQMLQARALDYAGTMLDARRNRILSNRQGIPLVLWSSMLTLGAITVVFAFYFRVDRPRAQYLMVIALTAVVSITFALIAELDYPFRGDIALDPYAFQHVIDALHTPVSRLHS